MAAARTQMLNPARALRSIGAKQIQRIGRGESVWRLGDSEME
jgi:hypothetical protein